MYVSRNHAQKKVRITQSRVEICQNHASRKENLITRSRVKKWPITLSRPQKMANHAITPPKMAHHAITQTPGGASQMGSLCVYYSVQKNKVDSSKGTGSSTDSVYKPHWKFYEDIEFLRDMVTPRRTYSNIDTSNDDLLFEDAISTRVRSDN